MPNALIGERSPPALWGKPLTKLKAHHLGSHGCQCYVNESGGLVEVRICAEPVRATEMHERFLLMNTPQEFLCRWDWSVTPIIGLNLMNRERECDKSPLSPQQMEAVLTL